MMMSEIQMLSKTIGAFPETEAADMSPPTRPNVSANEIAMLNDTLLMPPPSLATGNWFIQPDVLQDSSAQPFSSAHNMSQSIPIRDCYHHKDEHTDLAGSSEDSDRTVVELDKPSQDSTPLAEPNEPGRESQGYAGGVAPHGHTELDHSLFQTSDLQTYSPETLEYLRKLPKGLLEKALEASKEPGDDSQQGEASRSPSELRCEMCRKPFSRPCELK